ncbi:MAG: hypothetical protein AB2551_00275 [Candidatus Thiodiazotropha sp.]
MQPILKGIAIASLIGIAGGVIAYFLVVFWLMSQGVTESGELVDIIRSKTAMYWSMPFTLICVLFSVYFATRKRNSSHYVVALATAVLIGISIHIGPLKIVTIHMNHLPIIIGAFIGALVASKLNNSSKRNAVTGAPS